MEAKLTRLTHKIAIQLHLVAEAASPETFGYTLVVISLYLKSKNVSDKRYR
jgi:hypothetical protein